VLAAGKLADMIGWPTCAVNYQTVARLLQVDE
jgi:hypothetical protein